MSVKNLSTVGAVNSVSTISGFRSPTLSTTPTTNQFTPAPDNAWNVQLVLKSSGNGSDAVNVQNRSSDTNSQYSTSLIRENLANQLNVSVDRIQDLTVNPVSAQSMYFQIF